MAAAALLTPFLATTADGVRRERVLTGIGIVRAAMLTCAAAVIRAGGPPAVTYGLAVVATVVLTLYRPAHSVERVHRGQHLGWRDDGEPG